MINHGKIGLQEAVALITITITIKVYFTSPSFLTKILGTASWYMALISAVTAIVGFTIICTLLKRFPRADLIDAFEQSLGRSTGFIFSIVLWLFLLINSAVLLREFAEVLKVYTLPLTPPSFVIALALTVSAIACFIGLESIARTARLLGYFLLAGFLIVIILAWNNYNYRNLFPFLGYGLTRTLTYGAFRSSFYGEVIALGIIATSMQGLSHIKKAGYTALVISGLILAAAISSEIMALNYAAVQETTSGMYALSKLIHIGAFLQRLEPFFIFVWCIGTLISTSFLLYCFMTTYCKAFRMQDMRPVIIPMVIILFTAAMIPDDLTTVMAQAQILRHYGWIIFFGLPFIALTIAVIRKKKGVPKRA